MPYGNCCTASTAEYNSGFGRMVVSTWPSLYTNRLPAFEVVGQPVWKRGKQVVAAQYRNLVTPALHLGSE